MLLTTSALSPWLLAGGVPMPAGILLVLVGCAWQIKPLRVPALLALPAILSLWVTQTRQADWLDPDRAGVTRQVVGRVVDLPARRADLLEFHFRVAHAEPGDEPLPHLYRVRWYEPPADVLAGQAWRFPLRLQPPRGRLNFTGPDLERRLFADGIGALATVSPRGAPQLMSSVPDARTVVVAWRESLRQRIRALLADEPAVSLVLALSLADRSGLDPRQWAEFARTGTGHLLAVSGLHIGFAAMIGYRLGWLLMLPLGRRWRAWAAILPPWLCALSLASIYAMLAGFGVSTRRALVMLGVLALTALVRRRIAPWLGWLMALCAIVIFEPTAPLRAGFWLSFGAVLVLLVALSPRTGGLGRLGIAFRAQWAIALAMIPLGMFWFQRVTGLGLIANPFAIPVVSLVLVPLILMGVLALALVGEGVAGWLLLPASWAAAGLSRALAWLAGQGGALQTMTGQPSVLATAIASMGLLLLLGPRGWRSRFAGLALAVGALSLASAGPRPGAIRLDLLDVGQGLAAIVSNRDTAVVYDTGPGRPGEWDLVESVLMPGLRSAGHSAPDRILVGHGDLDHAGGLAALVRHFPDVPVWVNPPNRIPSARPCDGELAWADLTASYQVLHPSPFLPYMGNLSSCVLSIRTPDHTLLLPGDVDRAVEQRLVAEGLQPHSVLVAPHHGSRTSSAPEFLEAAQPGLVLIPAGAGNRFGFPHADVIQRYRTRGVPSISVSDCGALRLEAGPGPALTLRSARRQRAAAWRWPAGADCP